METATTIQAAAVPTQSKDSELFSNNPRIIAKIRALLIAGQKYTAKQLNAVCGFNDSRKVISVLRAKGMKIQDVRLENRCKLYWYVPDNDSQLSLFEKGAENGN